MTLSRRQARELALRACYACELSGNPVERIIEEMIDQVDRDERTRQFAARLLRQSVEHRDEVEKYIIKQAHNWDFDRIAVLDKLIMRMCIAEFLYFPDIPPKVSIDEALEVSKKYSTEKSSVFINGVLDGVLASLKSSGLLKKSGRGLDE